MPCIADLFSRSKIQHSGRNYTENSYLVISDERSNETHSILLFVHDFIQNFQRTATSRGWGSRSSNTDLQSSELRCRGQLCTFKEGRFFSEENVLQCVSSNERKGDDIQVLNNALQWTIGQLISYFRSPLAQVNTFQCP